PKTAISLPLRLKTPQTLSLTLCISVPIALKTSIDCQRGYGCKPCMNGCKNHSSWACQPPPKAVNKRTAVRSCSFFKSSMACSAFKVLASTCAKLRSSTIPSSYCSVIERKACPDAASARSGLCSSFCRPCQSPNRCATPCQPDHTATPY